MTWLTTVVRRRTWGKTNEFSQRAGRRGGGTLPDGFRALSERALSGLTEAVRQTKSEYLVKLDEATQQALAHLPAMLRGPARKILGV